MRKPLRLLIKIGLVAGFSLLGLRLWQQIARPQLLLGLAHLIFIVSLLAFMAWVSVAARRQDRPEPAESVRLPYSEPLALVFASLLIAAAFTLVGWNWLQFDRPVAALVTSVVPVGHLPQALTAAGVTLAGIWAVFVFLQTQFSRHDPFIYPIVALLGAVGLVFLYRLSPDIADLRGIDAFSGLFRRQLISWGVSILLLGITMALLNGRRVANLTGKRYVYAALAVALIGVTAIVGVEHHGRKLAVNLVVMEFQSVELVKLLALFFMVGYFRYEMGYLHGDQGRLGLPRPRFWVPYLIMWALVLLSLVLQQDLGPAVVLFCLFLTMFYLGTGSGGVVILGFLLMVAVGVLAYWAGFPSMVRTRVDMWLVPFAASQNLAEALWAVGSGRFFGTGIGQGYAHHIPVVQSDFNFAIIAEEWGLLGAGGVLWAFGLLIGRVLALGRRMELPYLQMLLVGVATVWVVQVFVIVGGNIGLLPLTGITLPFISYGGSSLVMNMLALGIVLRLSHERASGKGWCEVKP